MNVRAITSYIDACAYLAVAINRSMATSIVKQLCATCNIQRGIFKCDGCSNMFCSMHTVQHRQAITQGLVDVEEIRDSVQTILTEQANDPQVKAKSLCDKLTKIVNDWEEQSIQKIRQVAEEVRSNVVQKTTGRLNQMQLRLQQLSDELQQSRRNDDFIEPDLNAWKGKLNQLKDELIKSPKVVVREDYTKLIPNLGVYLLCSQELFESSSGNAGFAENGHVVYIKNGPDIYTEVRGGCEYTSGRHIINMKVEELTGWILFGIISQSTPLQIHSYNSSSCYGWYNGHDFNYAAGLIVCGQGNDVIQNDLVQLFIDCDAQLIRLINERANRILELKVDIGKCPFPWKLHLNLNVAPTRIRILSSAQL